MSAEKELAVVPPKEKALQIFQTPKGLDPYLQIVRDKIDAFVPDVTTRKGRDAIASIAYTVARSKTALDNRGKELVAELKEIPKLIDAERKRMRDTLDTWQEEVRRPLNEWQAKEDARVEFHNSMIRHIEDCGLGLIGGQPQPFGLLFRELEEKIIVDEKYQEFEAEAHRVKAAALAKLRASFDEHQKREAEQAELARLRSEAEARAKAERDAEIARAAAEKARLEAEQKAQAERDAAAKREQDLKDQAAAQQRAAEQKIRDAEAEAERQKLQIKLQEEQAARQKLEAEQERIAATQRADQERIAAEKRQAEAVERARLAEIDRANKAAEEIVRQQELRAADTAHKASINRAALEAFIAGGMPEACAKQAVTLIAQRKIPNISIQY
ncbi:hypothetical protein V2I84_05345 [Pseudomonas viridiflava]|uniref:hypothetical protein n=1 Tax=Pseudomonas viridiflava TaxID=33069 RepID=UPI002EBB9035|nr:hypothetical protein [Pseudomonas viridiflava]MEE3980879.1 hypothetical protein [Pseudomonas viridiflava]MEE3989613.1 hypothetical protein [Pseudomonas viridiflava]MEE4028159.1 hypothetical protein [Pseudomonas viridiflava]MEE4034323.1 hypothetical protein [Pseudomonas viridiflava]